MGRERRNKGGNGGKGVLRLSFLICKIEKWSEISVSSLWTAKLFILSL